MIRKLQINVIKTECDTVGSANDLHLFFRHNTDF